MDEIIVNGEKYVKAGHAVTGSRCVVVVDRGWIFAGDVTEDGSGDGYGYGSGYGSVCLSRRRRT